tara:strand:- start:414 stop:668 length:255 start_codon:yes stop_codon:yes gene_type:complete
MHGLSPFSWHRHHPSPKTSRFRNIIGQPSQSSPDQSSPCDKELISRNSHFWQPIGFPCDDEHEKEEIERRSWTKEILLRWVLVP